jgi:hypothetical protein
VLAATLLASLLPASLGDSLAAQTDFTVETVSEKPVGVPGAIASLLAAEGHRVSGTGGVVGTFWLRQEMPKRPSPGELGIDFGHVTPGALVGLVELGAVWTDYRKLPVQPGLYTLRYGVQPADGDHMGQTYFRDFLMLVPVADDTFPPDGVGGMSEAEPMIEAAKKSTGTAHPGVMALYQIYEAPPAPIAMVANDYGEPCLAIQLGDVVMGIVVEGHGQSLPV